MLITVISCKIKNLKLTKLKLQIEQKAFDQFLNKKLNALNYT